MKKDAYEKLLDCWVSPKYIQAYAKKMAREVEGHISKEEIAARKKEAVKTVKKLVKDPEWRKKVIKVLKKYFTSKDAAAITRFSKTAAGLKFLAGFPFVQEQMTAITQDATGCCAGVCCCDE